MSTVWISLRIERMQGYIPADIVRLIPYVAPSVFSVGLAVGAFFTCGRRRDVCLFIAFVALEAILAIAFIFEVFSASIERKLFWNAIGRPLRLAVQVLYVQFARSFVKPSDHRSSPTLLTLLVAPVAIAVVVAAMAIAGITAPLYARIGRMVLPFSPLVFEPSALAYGMVLYGYCLFIAALVVIARHAFEEGANRMNGAPVLLAGFGVQLAGTLLVIAFRLPSGSIWTSPIWTSIRDALFVYGLFGERIVGPLTKARRAVMDTLLDPVFVLGEGETVVDYNAAAKTLLGAGAGEPMGASARALFADWPSSVVAALDFPEAETELDLPDREGVPRRSYRITVASNSARDRSGAWKLLVFNDISGQKSDARDMAATNEELEFWVRQRTTALRQEVAQRTLAEERLRELNDEMAKTQREILWTLSEVVESRSRETAYHVVRVGEYARVLSQAYGLSEEEVDVITAAAPMHDVGKIAVPDAILSKPGRLTDEEREIMKRHTVIGNEILGSSMRPLLRAASVIALEHHERWDGKGYPHGKSGADISLSGRIVSICDVFDALYTKRVYKEAWPLDKVLELFKTESGGAFEPRLVDILLSRIDDFLEITERFEDATEVQDL
ncbi:MAG: hypothetical protein CVV47_11565 [Spirochaetae bacterium HGW-Spirochaetae-3]|nr:MAG: hypothetical protein CVV47_11565 [Spirochaetae bacterium HGW-Spirochaetae-3]